MYTLYTDKSELFEAAISVSGASISNTLCRLLIESDSSNLIFHGNIDRDGKCKIQIGALAKFLSEGDSGTMKLEVIAENAYFVPWESAFIIETNKKVTAEVISHKETPIIVEAASVKMKPQTKQVSPVSNHSKRISKLLAKKMKTDATMAEIKFIFESYIKKYKIDDAGIREIKHNIGKELRSAVGILAESTRDR